jgi:hypothetical protein
MSNFEQPLAGKSNEREKRAEVMVRFLEVAKNITAFHGKPPEAVLSLPESRREFLENLTEDQFQELLNGINGVIRGKKKEEWQPDTKEGGVVMSSMFFGEQSTPRYQEKEVLLSEVFQGMQEMLHEGRSLEDIAILLGASINEIHLFQDANGRTSRLIYTLISNGFSDHGKDSLKKVLQDDGRRVVDIDPSLISRNLDAIILEEAGQRRRSTNPDLITNLWHDPDSKIAWRDNITDNLKEEFKRVYDDHVIGFAVLYKHVMQQEDKEQFLKRFENRSVIRLDLLVPQLKAEQISELIGEYWQQKKRHGALLIDCVVNPEKPEYRVVENDESMTFLEKFKMRIEERRKKD